MDSLLKSTQGFFSCIIAYEDKLLLIADHMRSYPLYYRISGENIIVSDDPQTIADLKHDTLSTMATLEFLCTGYATGEETLIEGLKQVEPGTYTIFHDGKVEKRTYFDYRPCIEQSVDQESYYDAFVNALDNAFRRLRVVARGSQIALPLSGGFDSRLIALCLKNFDFENVVTFSYGRPGNRDSEESKKVAEELGFDWYFIPYSNELWKKVSKSKSWLECCSYAFQFSSIPHLQDFPAIESLADEGVIEANAVITPGHRPGGARIPRIVPDANGIVSRDQIISDIMSHHYSLWRFKSGSAIDNAFRSRISDSLGLYDAVHKTVAASIRENWYLRERESKFIAHSVRDYEYLGFNWWLPLLDKEFISFWEKTAYSCKEHKCYYRSVLQLMKETIGGPARVDCPVGEGDGLAGTAAAPERRLSSIDTRIESIRRCPFVNKLLYDLGYFREREYDNSNLAFFGLVDKREFMRTYTGTENINSFIALGMVKDLIDPAILASSERELFRSIDIYKSNMLKYLQRNSKSIRNRRSHSIKQ